MGGPRFILGVATLGGVGLLPGAPGTWGSVAALPLWWGLSHLGLWIYLGVWLLLVAAGWWAAPRAAELLGGRDHPAVVIDEAAGQLLTLAGVPPSWGTALLGLTLFRLLDILKPWPLKELETLPGGWGVMADDLAAAALAWVGLQVAMWVAGGGG